ncbi:MAG: carboxymuconolactone decarboxylase family protein [Xanthomonadaceae bacterium]|nr:carboxymuconolactone decarboxylase family protein [Xanthomonadaceae bacterium]
MTHMKPLPKDATPALAETFKLFEDILGFVPNSLLTMQRRPAIVEGFGALTRAVMDLQGAVDPGFKRLIAHFASTAAGCRYCEAHSLVAARIHGIDDERLAALWEYETSPLYTEAERAALSFALAAGSVPNAVTEEHFTALREYWSDDEIVEILAAVCLYGFLNRWNDSMATDLEDAPKALADEVLKGGWSPGKHRT